MVYSTNLCKVLRRGAVFLHILAAGIAEELGCSGRVCNAAGCLQHGVCGRGGVLAVVKVGLQAAGRHLLEADDQDAVGGAVGDGLSGHVQTGRACRAIVVHVIDRDLGHAELVEDALAAGGVAVAVACNALVDLVVVDLGIEHGLDAGFEAEFMVIDFASGLDELGHANA